MVAVDPGIDPRQRLIAASLAPGDDADEHRLPRGQNQRATAVPLARIAALLTRSAQDRPGNPATITPDFVAVADGQVDVEEFRRRIAIGARRGLAPAGHRHPVADVDWIIGQADRPDLARVVQARPRVADDMNEHDVVAFGIVIETGVADDPVDAINCAVAEIEVARAEPHAIQRDIVLRHAMRRAQHPLRRDQRAAAAMGQFPRFLAGALFGGVAVERRENLCLPWCTEAQGAFGTACGLSVKHAAQSGERHRQADEMPSAHRSSPAACREATRSSREEQTN